MCTHTVMFSSSAATYNANTYTRKYIHTCISTDLCPTYIHTCIVHTPMHTYIRWVLKLKVSRKRVKQGPRKCPQSHLHTCIHTQAFVLWLHAHVYTYIYIHGYVRIQNVLAHKHLHSRVESFKKSSSESHCFRTAKSEAVTAPLMCALQQLQVLVHGTSLPCKSYSSVWERIKAAQSAAEELSIYIYTTHVLGPGFRAGENAT